SCMRGCRLYGMIFLAHDPIVARTETASLCAKSCTSGGSSDAKTEACAADGRPRYLVELAERAIPLRLARLTGGGPRQVAVQADSHRRSPFASYWFDHPHSSILRYRHLSHRTRVALRWAACGILIASLIGLLCLCCSLARSTNQRQIRVLRSAIVKRQPPPSIQSGDILIGKKQQLLLPEKPADTI
uniref:WSC domain-containing protein n=1 Tax=Macrostomum lignano TaxID=282301 RepID=A0A1I8GLT2_9PLAT